MNLYKKYWKYIRDRNKATNKINEDQLLWRGELFKEVRGTVLLPQQEIWKENKHNQLTLDSRSDDVID